MAIIILHLLNHEHSSFKVIQRIETLATIVTEILQESCHQTGVPHWSEMKSTQDSRKDTSEVAGRNTASSRIVFS